MEQTAMAIDRRQFLTGLLGGGAAAGLVHFSGMGQLLSMAEASASTVPARGPFVLCTLYGGNDGLNTVIPFESALYREWRRELAVPGDQVLPLGGADLHLGFHPSLTSLYSLWKQGKVAVVLGVEYPKPNFSHFASRSIWQTAEPSGDPGTGWLGRWLDVTGKDPFRAISVGPTLPIALVGAKQQAGSVVDSTSPGSQLPGQAAPFSVAYRQMMRTSPGEPALQAGQASSGAHFLEIGAEAATALSKEKAPAIPGDRDAGDIGNQLQIVAELISYGFPASVYSVSWSSFDTHSAQANTHAGLLSSLDAAIGAFMSDFPTPRPKRSPVLMVCSEFGRTPKVNASGGTDHSSASVMLLVGPGVKGGFYGAMPSFTHLDEWGNLYYTTDFRRVYTTVLEQVLGTQARGYILGGHFRPVEFL
jgi:uncharacterized protein (DUF1501 family)